MKFQFLTMSRFASWFLLFIATWTNHLHRANAGDIVDITDTVFGSMTDTIPVAYGDFNSDELFDMFVLRNNFRTIQILFGSDDKPLLQAGPKCEYKNFHITSVVPGDFDGDAYMDVMFTVQREGEDQGVYINWGGSEYMNCTKEDEEPLIVMRGQPLALDYDKDFIIDLFGMDTKGERKFWIFKKPKEGKRKPPDTFPMDGKHGALLKVPHSHAIIDLDKDFTADLLLTTENNYEVWKGTETEKEFFYSHKIDFPVGNYDAHIGQSIFLDAELDGNLLQIVPIALTRIV